MCSEINLTVHQTVPATCHSLSVLCFTSATTWKPGRSVAEQERGASYLNVDAVTHLVSGSDHFYLPLHFRCR